MALASKKTHNAVNIGAVSANNADLDVADAEDLTILASLTAAVAGDLILEVRAYDADDALFDLALPAVRSVAPALSGGVSRTIQVFDVAGIDKVQVRVRNNHATVAQTGNASAFTRTFRS